MGGFSVIAARVSGGAGGGVGRVRRISGTRGPDDTPRCGGSALTRAGRPGPAARRVPGSPHPVPGERDAGGPQELFVLLEDRLHQLP